MFGLGADINYRPYTFFIVKPRHTCVNRRRITENVILEMFGQAIDAAGYYAVRVRTPYDAKMISAKPDVSSLSLYKLGHNGLFMK